MTDGIWERVKQDQQRVDCNGLQDNSHGTEILTLVTKLGGANAYLERLVFEDEREGLISISALMFSRWL